MTDPIAQAIWLAGATAGIFAVVNPLQSLTVFRYLTQGFTKEEREGVIHKAVLAGGGFLGMFVIVGDLLFRLYRISVPAFRIAGGIIVLFVALKMVRGEPLIDVDRSPTGGLDRERRESLGVTPLAVPLLAGPAAIGTVMLYASGASDPVDTGIVLAAIGVVFLLTYLIFSLADQVFATLGESGLAISSAMMGLLLAAVAVQFVLDGIHLALRQWGLAL